MKSYGRRHWIELTVVAIMLIVLTVSFFRFYVRGEFTTYDFVPCDPALHQCFVTECSSDDPRCSPYPTEDGTFTFAIQKHSPYAVQDYYCSEETIALFSNLVLDPTCEE